MSTISGHRWRHATPTRVAIVRQASSGRVLVYQTCLRTFERVANWDGFVDLTEARQWIRARSWPGVISIVELP